MDERASQPARRGRQQPVDQTTQHAARVTDEVQDATGCAGEGPDAGPGRTGTQGGPAGSTELVATWIYKKTFISYDVGYGCALSLTVCMTIVIIYVLQSVIRGIVRRRNARELEAA